MARPNASEIRVRRARGGILAITGPLVPLERLTALHLAVASVVRHQVAQTGLTTEACLHGFGAAVEAHLQSGRGVVPLDPADCTEATIVVEGL